MAARRLKRPARLALVAALAFVALLAAAITFTIGWRPFFGPKARAATERKFDATPERLAPQALLEIGRSFGKKGVGHEQRRCGAAKAVGETIPGTYNVGGRRMSRSTDRVRDSSLQDR